MYMTDNQTKAIMSAILYSHMNFSTDPEVCQFDMAAGLAEELFQHVLGNAGHGHGESAMPEVDPRKAN
jgi:hypothetical protein